MEHQRPTKAAYSIVEFAEALSLGRTTIFSAIRAGKIKAVKAGSRTIIPACEIAAYLELLASEQTQP